MRLRRLVALFAFILSLTLGDLALFTLPAYADSTLPQPPEAGCGGIGPPSNQNTDCNTGGIQLTVKYKAKDGSTGICPSADVYMTPSQGDKRSFGLSADGKANANYFHVGTLKLEVTTANSSAGCDPGNGNVYTGTDSVTMTKDKILVHTMTLTTETAKSDDSNDADCDVGSFTWLVCPLILAIDKAISWAEGVITSALTIQTLDSSGDLNKVWSNFRNLADVFLILVFFVVIFGTAIGMDNYTVKKVLPRLIAAAILVQFSFLIMQVAVDISNVLGLGITALFAGIGGSSGNSGSTAMTIIGAGQLAAIAAVVALAVTPEIMITVLLTLGSALLGLFAAFITLEVRQLMIDFLVVLSPVALILWVLPNTEKWYKRWREYLLDLLLMFPIIVILFQIGNLFSRIVATGGSDVTDFQKFIAALVPIIIFFLIPATFKLASKSLSSTSNFLNGKANSARSKAQNSSWLKRKQEEGQEKGLQKLQNLKQEGKGGTFGARKAQQRAGFGFFKNPTKQSAQTQRRIIAATEKAASDQASLDAIRNHEAQHGVRSFDDMKASKQSIAEEKLMDARVNEVLLSQVTVRNSEGVMETSRLANVDLSEEARQMLVGMITNPKSDQATQIAAIQSLSRSTGGRNELSKLRAGDLGNGMNADGTRAFFGGTDFATAAPEHLDTWKKGTANVKGDAAPDLVKPTATAFKGVSGAEWAAMDPGTKGRYAQYAKLQMEAGDASIAHEQEAAIGAAMSAPTLRSRVGKDDLERVYNVAKDTPGLLSDSGSFKQIADSYEKAGGVIEPDIRTRIDAAAGGAGSISTVTSPSVSSTATVGSTPGTVRSVGTVSWNPGPAASAGTPRGTTTSRTANVGGSQAAAPAPGGSGTPLVSSNFNTTSTNNNTTNNTNNTTQNTASTGRTAPTAGRQATTSNRLAPQNITVQTPQQSINLEASEIGHAVGSEIESIANRTARRGGMAPGQVPVIGQPNTYPPGSKTTLSMPSDGEANLVDPKVEGQDDEPGDERSMS